MATFRTYIASPGISALDIKWHATWYRFFTGSKTKTAALSCILQDAGLHACKSTVASQTSQAMTAKFAMHFSMTAKCSWQLCIQTTYNLSTIGKAWIPMLGLRNSDKDAILRIVGHSVPILY